MKEALAVLTLGRRALRIWVFAAEVLDVFILCLDVLRAYGVSAEIRRKLLLLDQEEVTLWRPCDQTNSTRLCLIGDEVISARFERIVMTNLEAHLGAINVLLEPSQKCSRD